MMADDGRMRAPGGRPGGSGSRRKSRRRLGTIDNRGGFQIIDSNSNWILAGVRLDMSPADDRGMVRGPLLSQVVVALRPGSLPALRFSQPGGGTMSAGTCGSLTRQAL
jgi:hypothetical protein